MTATGHAVTGVALATLIVNPVIGIPVAILSHVACDAFPHWDTGTNMKKKSRQEFVIGSFIDLGISLTIPYLLVHFLFPQLNLFYVYVMVIAAQGLDWGSAPAVFLKWKFPPFSWILSLQGTFDNRLDKPLGVIYQVAALLILLGFAYLKTSIS